MFVCVGKACTGYVAVLAGSRSDVIHSCVVTTLMGRVTTQGVPAHSQGVTGTARLDEDQGKVWRKQLVEGLSFEDGFSPCGVLAFASTGAGAALS